MTKSKAKIGPKNSTPVACRYFSVLDWQFNVSTSGDTAELSMPATYAVAGSPARVMELMAVFERVAPTNARFCATIDGYHHALIAWPRVVELLAGTLGHDFEAEIRWKSFEHGKDFWHHVTVKAAAGALPQVLDFVGAAVSQSLSNELRFGTGPLSMHWESAKHE